MAKFIGENSLAELVSKTKTLIATKQNTLVSGTNIKTINNTSLLGSGNISISAGTPTDVQINGTSITSNNVANILTNTAYNSSTNKIATMSDLPSVSGKQDTLPATGSTTQPIYVSSAGTISTASTYAGGTKVTLNGTSKGGSTASFYAPTSAISTSTAKRYLLGGSTTSSIATTNTNASCYMQSGKLYSNGNEVQEKLVSGTSIKTINGNDILGSGDITISGGTTTDVKINGTSITSSGVADIKTQGTYNASTNKIATMSDVVPGNPTTWIGSAPYLLYNTGSANQWYALSSLRAHTIRAVEATYTGTTTQNVSWTISVALSAGEYISGFMWVPNADGSYENNRLRVPNGAPTFSQTGIVSSATTVTITVPMTKGSGSGTCGAKATVFITKIG